MTKYNSKDGLNFFDMATGSLTRNKLLMGNSQSNEETKYCRRKLKDDNYPKERFISEYGQTYEK